MGLFDKIFGTKYECTEFNGIDGYKEYTNTKTGEKIKIALSEHNTEVDMKDIRLKLK